MNRIIIAIFVLAFCSCGKKYTCTITTGTGSDVMEKRFATKGAMNKWKGENTKYTNYVQYQVAECVPAK